MSLEDLLKQHAVAYTEFDDVAVCTCGGRFHDDTSDYYQRDGVVSHCEHLATVIREHMGHMRYRVASTLGPRYMLPTAFDALSEAELFMHTHDRLVGDLPGAKTLRIEYQFSTDWMPLGRAEEQ